MSEPSIGVVIPCINQAAYVLSALRSVCRQTYLNWQCVVVSDDAACHRAVLKSAGPVRKVQSILLARSVGVSRARNIGIERLRTDFIVALDADDFLSRRYFRRAADLLSADKNLKVVD